MRILGSVAVGVWLLCGTAASAGASGQGIDGLVTHRGKMIAGATVAAWQSLDDLGARKAPVAVSGGTGAEGQYRLELPPGEYYLAAGIGSGWKRNRAPAPGDLYCFFGNNPVTIRRGEWTPVGFNLVEVRQDPPAGEGPAGISGRLLFEGEPLEKAYVFAYRADQPRFRGQGQAFAPAGKGGEFRLRLAPGSYYLVARKRRQGSLTGPLSHGDYVGYYPANPVVIGVGERRSIIIELAQRLDNLDGGGNAGAGEAGAGEGSKTGPAMAMGYAGRVLDRSGRPRDGIRVLAYESGTDGMGTPLFISEPTDASGRFRLPIPRPGAFLLVARESIGGKAKEGEWYGRVEGKAISLQAMVAQVEIRVSPFGEAEGR